MEIFVKQEKRKGRPRGSITRDVTNHLIVEERRRHKLQDISSNSPVRRCSVRLKSPSPQIPPKRGQGRPRKGEKLSFKTQPSLICSNEPAAYPPSSSGTSSRPLLYLLESSILSQLSYKKLPKVKQVLRRLEGLLLEQDFSQQGNKMKEEIKRNSIKIVCSKIQDIWRHHFGLRLIDGLDFENQNLNIEERENKKMIIRQNDIEKRLEIFTRSITLLSMSLVESRGDKILWKRSRS